MMSESGADGLEQFSSQRKSQEGISKLSMRRLEDALYEFQTQAVDLLNSKRRKAKLVLELHCDKGQILEPGQILSKHATGS